MFDKLPASNSADKTLKIGPTAADSLKVSKVISGNIKSIDFVAFKPVSPIIKTASLWDIFFKYASLREPEMLCSAKALKLFNFSAFSVFFKPHRYFHTGFGVQYFYTLGVYIHN